MRHHFKRQVELVLRYRFPEGLTLSEAYLEDDFLHFGAVLIHAFTHPGFSKAAFWDSWDLIHPEVKKLEQATNALGQILGDETQVRDVFDQLWDEIAAQEPDLDGKEAPDYLAFSRFRGAGLARLIIEIVRKEELQYELGPGSGHFAWAASSDLEGEVLAERFFHVAYPRMQSNAVFREISTKGAAGTQGEVSDVLEAIHARNLPPRRMSKDARGDAAKLPPKILYEFKKLTKGFRFFINSPVGTLTEGCDYWYSNGGGKILSLVGIRGPELVYLDASWAEWAE